MADELAMQVAIARFNYSASELPEGCEIIASDLDESIANAVRAFLLSDEAVSRMAIGLAAELKSNHVYVSDDLRKCLVDGGLFDLHDTARAALTAVIGEG